MSDECSFYINILVAMRFDLEKKPMTQDYQAQIEAYKTRLSGLSLLELKTEYQRAELVRLKFGTPEHALTKTELVEKGHFEERLSKLSSSELVRNEAASEDETVKNLVNAHRFCALTPERRADYFGEPPKYGYWGALDCWKLDGATSLTMGLDPKVDLFSKMKEPREVFAASSSSSRAEEACNAVKVSRAELWKEISVRGFPTDPLFGICDESEAALERWAFADAATEYIQLQDRIRRAIDAGKLDEKIIPAGYILWAADSGIAVPNELKQAVEAWNEIPNWEARYDDLLKQHKSVVGERDVFSRELTEMKSEADRDTIEPTERRSVCRLIIGMAIGGYAYNPKAGRNTAVREIFDDLQRFGVPRDMDTIRKWLQESAKELPSDWDQHNRGARPRLR
jgi:hypothetical protein